MKKSAKLFFTAAAVAAIGIAGASVMAFASQDDGEIPIPDGYSKLVFSDDFSTDGAPDPEKWNFERGYVRNGELQYYTDRNAECRDGLLIIEARADSAEFDGERRAITSSSITTQGKHAWKYGYVEVRAKLPASKGTWPAIWMMPNESSYGKWPR